MVAPVALILFAAAHPPPAAQSVAIAPDGANEAPPLVSRRDLADLVQRLDARLARPLIEGELAGPALRSANERFDQLSLSFFALRFHDVYLELDGWLCELGGTSEPGTNKDVAPGAGVAESLSAALARNRAEWRPWQPLDGARARVEALLAAPEAAAIDEATSRVLRARLALLVDEPSPDRSRELLLATPALARAVESEARRALAGERPYANARGDLWRTVAHRRRDLPLRLYVPPALNGPLPLVVAFHGAGGDENFLFELAGDGYLKRLADAHGFAVACPLTMDFAYAPSALDALLDGLAVDYTLDPERVFLFGHSLGAAAVASLCGLRPKAIAKAVLVGGLGAIDAEAPPMLVIGGSLDPLARAASIERAVEVARAGGADVELALLPDQGHTLILPEALRRAVGFWFGD